MMLATIESVQLLDHAEELANMIVDSDIAQHYRECRYRVETNQETQRKIRAFASMKERYEEVQRFGKYHPDYKEVMGKIRILKREVDLDGHVAELRKAENDLQDLLDQISVLLGNSVSPSVKVPTGNPFFSTGSSCGGGCGSGGSCGCA